LNRIEYCRDETNRKDETRMFFVEWHDVRGALGHREEISDIPIALNCQFT